MGRIALFNLDEYESAKEAFEAAHSLDKRRETEIWIRKCNAELEGTSRDEHAITLDEYPSHTALPPNPSNTVLMDAQARCRPRKNIMAKLLQQTACLHRLHQQWELQPLPQHPSQQRQPCLRSSSPMAPRRRGSTSH